MQLTCVRRELVDTDTGVWFLQFTLEGQARGFPSVILSITSQGEIPPRTEVGSVIDIMIPEDVLASAQTKPRKVKPELSANADISSQNSPSSKDKS